MWDGVILKTKTKKVKKCPNNPARKKKCNWPLTWKIGLSLQTTSTIKSLLQKKELSSICPNYLIKIVMFDVRGGS